MSDSRSMVAMSRTVGNKLKSSGRLINSEVSRTKPESVMEKVSITSSSHFGIGRISTTRMKMTPSASATSPWRSVSTMRESPPASATAVELLSDTWTKASRPED